MQAVQPCVHAGRRAGHALASRFAACVPTAQVAAGPVPGWWRCRGLPELRPRVTGHTWRDSEDLRGEGEEELGEDEDDVGLAPRGRRCWETRRDDDRHGGPTAPPGAWTRTLPGFPRPGKQWAAAAITCVLPGPFLCCPQPLVDSNLGSEAAAAPS